MSIQSFKDLDVWKMSMDLVDEIYKITEQLPRNEIFGLSSQLQRASVSIPSNIAEGSKRSSRADFRYYCLMALGSSAEVETQLIIVARRYSNIDVEYAMNLVVRVQKMLTSLGKSLKPTTVRQP